jgi:hypothetical protein
MAVTFRQLINRVLLVLDPNNQVSDSATELTDAYHKLVAAFVNHIKEEVEDSHNWRKLRQSIDVTINAGLTDATIAGTNERSRLYREFDEVNGIERPLVIDITTSGQEFPLQEIDLARLRYLNEVNQVTNSRFSPQFAIDDTSGDTLDLAVYPESTVNRTYRLNLIVPQSRFNTSTDLNTNILVPARPVELGALWYALEERGEELGVDGVFSENKYRKALDDAISRDAAEQGGYNLVPV